MEDSVHVYITLIFTLLCILFGQTHISFEWGKNDIPMTIVVLESMYTNTASTGPRYKVCYYYIDMVVGDTPVYCYHDLYGYTGINHTRTSPCREDCLQVDTHLFVDLKKEKTIAIQVRDVC